jgi:two-component system NtrC family sensor kinase
VENRSHPSHQAPVKLLAVHIDPLILDDLPADFVNPEIFNLVPTSEAQFSLMKKGTRLWVQFPDGEFCDYPYYLKNVTRLLDGFRTQSQVNSFPAETFHSFIKSTETIEKKMFSNVSMGPGENVKDLWDEIIKKVNSISAGSHSLKGLVEKILEVPFLQNFQTSLIILHLKGQTKAELMGTMWRSEKVHGLIEVKDFNNSFNSIRKSKIKSFTTDAFAKTNLPFNGSFLAKEVISKKYSLIAIVSRHDFLSYSQEEIELFETCIDLLQPHFERLIDQEFSDKKISELRICLKDFPLPLRIRDGQSGSSFMNDLYHNELQDQDIFFNKKVKGPFSLDLYDSDELRHYAFDLFHFQRISLLGELLNTLRHELSNPLFGLKLGSQIFTTLDVTKDDKELMEEIEKNVNRCQAIIENFSNLYQIQPDTKPVLLKKMIDESMTLAKSEIREVTKKVHFGEGTENLQLNVPLIFVVQVLFNLIVNAAQAMRVQDHRAELTIDVSLNDNLVQVDVTDNGAGIPEDKQINLFKPFFTTKSQGTGLGLVLSRNLTLKMGGNLEYVSNPLHKGASFRLTLPVT